MSNESDTRRGINKVARDFMHSAHKSGNTGYTFAEAKQRVTSAVAKGDQKRSNNHK